MANRVALDVAGLRVSKPGFNVLTTGDANMQFDSAWSQLKLHMKGSVAVSESSTPYTLLFGKAFSNRPLCWFLFGDRQMTNSGTAIWATDDVGGSITDFPAAGAVVQADRALLHRVDFTGTIRYVIWDLDL